ncbi:MAG: hypothetical protein CSB55_05950 [Candidatus Cloacimonadota bacterium]|nr:MAG: hypothetical protein CSB55_05950 [Candidatus Cloacimonadota bacterium]
MKKLCLILFAVIILGCGNYKNMYVAQIDGRDVEPKEYNRFVMRQYKIFRMGNSGMPTAEDIDLIESRAWDDMLKAFVLKKLYDEYNVSVTPQECIDSLLANPPSYLKNSPKFTVDNEFQRETYENSILHDEPYDMNWVKQNYLLNYLPFEKLKRKVIERESVLPEEIRKFYDEKYSMADLDLIKIENETIEQPNILPSEINRYYEEHKNEYRVNAYVKADYVVFPLIPGKEEDSFAKSKIDSIYALLKNGHDFAYAARKFSMAKSSVHSGNAGFVELNSVPRDIIRDWEYNNYSDISRPFKTGAGWVIYKPLRKTKSMIKVMEIFIKPEFSEKSEKRLLDRIIDLRETAKELGLKKASYEFDLKCVEADSVSGVNPDFPRLGVNEELFVRLLKTRNGELTEPFFIDEISSYVLVQSKKVKQNGYKSLFEVSENIRNKILSEKIKESEYRKAVNLCKNMTPELLNGEINAGKYKSLHFDYFDINTPVNGVVAEKMNLTLLKSNTGILPYPASYGSDLYLVRKNLSYPAPAELFNEHKEKIRREMINDINSDYFENWLRNKIKKMKVKDWRKKENSEEQR